MLIYSERTGQYEDWEYLLLLSIFYCVLKFSLPLGKDQQFLSFLVMKHNPDRINYMAKVSNLFQIDDERK